MRRDDADECGEQGENEASHPARPRLEPAGLLLVDERADVAAPLRREPIHELGGAYLGSHPHAVLHAGWERHVVSLGLLDGEPAERGLYLVVVLLHVGPQGELQALEVLVRSLFLPQLRGLSAVLPLELAARPAQSPQFEHDGGDTSSSRHRREGPIKGHRNFFGANLGPKLGPTGPIFKS